MADLPILYERWIASVLDAPSPSESRATCAECAMCPGPDGAMLPAAYPFRPDTKCCTYEPVIPNFLAGGILGEDEGDVGRRTLGARIEARRATPLGLYANWRMRTKWDGQAHGRSGQHRCPHFVVDGGACSIWRHRPHACATYFCKHERGRRGLVFWTAVGRLLKLCEEALAAWCVLESELPVPAQELMLIELERDPADPTSTQDVFGEVDEAAYAKMWGDWLGREGEFYAACAARVADLSWSDVLRIAGPDVALAANVVRRGHALLGSTELPERLRLGTWSVLGANPGAVTVQTHSPTDPISIDLAVLSVLHKVDGRRTDEVLADVEGELGVPLPPEALRVLTDFGVFVDG